MSVLNIRLLAIIGMLTYSTSALAAEDKYFCNAQCLGVNYDSGEVNAYGDPILEGSSVSIREAYLRAQWVCDDRAGGRGAGTLAAGVSVWRKDTGSSSSHWAQTTVVFPYQFRWYETSSGSRSYYWDKEFKLDIQFARMLDKTVCGEVKKDPKGTPKYLGPGIPMG